MSSERKAKQNSKIQEICCRKGSQVEHGALAAPGDHRRLFFPVTFGLGGYVKDTTLNEYRGILSDPGGVPPVSQTKAPLTVLKVSI